MTLVSKKSKRCSCPSCRLARKFHKLTAHLSKEEQDKLWRVFHDMDDALCGAMKELHELHIDHALLQSMISN